MSEWIGGLSLKNLGDTLCVQVGFYDCADLRADEVRDLRDYLTEWLALPRGEGDE